MLQRKLKKITTVISPHNNSFNFIILILKKNSVQWLITNNHSNKNSLTLFWKIFFFSPFYHFLLNHRLLLFFTPHSETDNTKLLSINISNLPLSYSFVPHFPSHFPLRKIFLSFLNGLKPIICPMKACAASYFLNGFSLQDGFKTLIPMQWSKHMVVIFERKKINSKKSGHKSVIGRANSYSHQ